MAEGGLALAPGLTGERGAKKRAHWQAVATAACEQCGRNRVPAIGLPIALRQWLTHIDESHPDAARWLLSLPLSNGVDAATTAPAPEPARADRGTLRKGSPSLSRTISVASGVILSSASLTRTKVIGHTSEVMSILVSSWTRIVKSPSVRHHSD